MAYGLMGRQGDFAAVEELIMTGRREDFSIDFLFCIYFCLFFIF